VDEDGPVKSERGGTLELRSVRAGDGTFINGRTPDPAARIGFFLTARRRRSLAKPQWSPPGDGASVDVPASRASMTVGGRARAALEKWGRRRSGASSAFLGLASLRLRPSILGSASAPGRPTRVQLPALEAGKVLGAGCRPPQGPPDLARNGRSSARAPYQALLDDGSRHRITFCRLRSTSWKARAR